MGIAWPMDAAWSMREACPRGVEVVCSPLVICVCVAWEVSSRVCSTSDSEMSLLEWK